MNNYLLLAFITTLSTLSYIITKLNTRGKIKNIKNNFLLKFHIYKIIIIGYHNIVYIILILFNKVLYELSDKRS